MLRFEDLAPERVRPLSRREYDRMVAFGMFEDERVELLHGVLVEMSPQGVRHARAVEVLNEKLVLALAGRARVRPQLPFAASDDSEPEPDLAVVPRERDAEDHPARAYLVIEVAESSLRKDRRIKADIYAAAGVPEYWLVNLVDRVVEVYTGVQDGCYVHRACHGPGEAVCPAAFPDVAISVADLMPAASG